MESSSAVRLPRRVRHAVERIRSGTPGALAALLGGAAAYGFVHAAGPGDGKYLIGGVGLGTDVSVARLAGLASAASLAQATSLVAISSAVVRGVTLASTGRLGFVGVAAPSLQLVAGVAIVGLSLALLGVPVG